ncbi:MAG: hypothetical protein GVY19_04295 [Bacteroidetes bacterium]|jgi:hypothetical protein|nr:hypothetical protein [Bacteroidota bacterium]
MKRIGLIAGMCVLCLYVQARVIKVDTSLIIKTKNVAEMIESAELAPEEYQHVIKKYRDIYAVALTFYPELRNKNIRIIEKSLSSTLRVRPTLFSLFSKSNRAYKIFIDTLKFNMDHYNNNIRFNAQTGAMGHELAHIIDYETKNNRQMIGMALKYVFSTEYRRKVERQTDSLAAARGLGQQLLVFRQYIHECPEIPVKYKKMKKKFYLSERELRKQLAEMKLND